MQLPTTAHLSTSDTDDDEAEVEVYLPSKQFGSTPVDLDALISAAEGPYDINGLFAPADGGWERSFISCVRPTHLGDPGWLMHAWQHSALTWLIF